jgi:hypothetical protein
MFSEEPESSSGPAKRAKNLRSRNMRKLKNVVLALSLLFVSSLAFAADKTAETASNGQFYLGLGGGIDVPTQNVNPAYKLGGAAEAQFGYAFSPEVAVQVQVDNNLDDATIAGIATSVYGLRPVAELKLSAPIDRFSPYLLAGAGVNVQFASATGLASSTNTSFDAVGGLGAQYDLGGAAIYVEGKYNFAFVNNVPNVSTIQDIPVEAGVNFTL